MSIFDRFTRKGPTLTPVERRSWWKEGGVTPTSHHRGTYTPVLDVRAPVKDDRSLSVLPEMPPKKRGTI